MRLFYPPRYTYFIWTPSWTHKSSGVRALHLLCHALNESGEKAYVFPSEMEFCCNPALNTPMAQDVVADWRAVPKSGLDYVVVYPDIVRGNPLGAKHVVRYLLAPAGKHGGDKEFPKTDKVYGYIRDLAEKVLNIPTFDYYIFHDRMNLATRAGSLYYAHKYLMHGNKLLPVSEGAKELKGEPREVAGLLRSAERLYVYERTEATVLAEMCGCEVVPVATEYWDGVPPEEYDTKASEPGGLATMPSFESQLREFIRDTQQWRA